jgi:hypothetical protein
LLVYHKIGKARVVKGAVYGELKGDADVSVDGKMMKLAFHATLQRVGGIGSCFSIAFLAAFAILRRSDSTMKSLRAHSDLELPELWKNISIFADIGEKMKLDTDCKHETEEFRVRLFRKMWDQCEQCSKHFRTAPSVSTLKEGTKIAAKLKMDVTIPDEDPFSIVKQCAIAILGPKTHFDEPYVLALLDLFFDGKIGVLVTSQIENVFVVSSEQPWISRDAVVAIAVLHENQLQSIDADEIREQAEAEAKQAGLDSEEGSADKSRTKMISKDVQENIGRITKEKQRANATAYHQQHFNIAQLRDTILLLRKS